MSVRRGVRRAGAIAMLLGAAGSVPASAQLTPREVITRAEIEAAGWVRLSELPFAVPGASRTTVDGVTVLGNVSGLPTWEIAPGRDEWLVLVDGQPVQPSFAGTNVLDLLPVAITQLDSVVVYRGPAFVAGRVAIHGVLRLYTQRGLRGTHGSASHYSGNEVGDAGPFTFTPAATPNIDNSGPFHALRLTHGDTAWDADLAFRRWTDNITDRRIADRHEAAAAPEAPELWIRHIAPTMRAGVSTANGRHDVHAGIAQLRGTFLVPSLREEQALRTRQGFLGVSGDALLGALTAGSYAVSVSELQADPFGAPLPATLAHRRRDLGATLAINRRFSRGWVEGGGVVAHQRLADVPALPAFSRDVATGAHAFAAAQLHAPWSPRAAATLGHGLDGARMSAAAFATPYADSIQQLLVSLAAERKAYGDDGAWIDLELLGIGYTATTRRASAIADVAWSRLTKGDIRTTIGAAVRRETGLLLLTRDTGGPPPAFAPEVSAPMSLTLGELRATLDFPPTSPIQGGAAYRFSQQLGGWIEAREAARSLPRHLLDASVVFTAFGDVRVRPAVSLASRTHWRDVGGAALEEVPAVTRLDLSLEKWFFHRHLRAQLLARNLLNDIERYHPLGADFRLRVFAGATLSF